MVGWLVVLVDVLIIWRRKQETNWQYSHGLKDPKNSDARSHECVFGWTYTWATGPLIIHRGWCVDNVDSLQPWETYRQFFKVVVGLNNIKWYWDVPSSNDWRGAKPPRAKTSLGIAISRSSSSCTSRIYVHSLWLQRFPWTSLLTPTNFFYSIPKLEGTIHNANCEVEIRFKNWPRQALSEV